MGRNSFISSSFILYIWLPIFPAPCSEEAFFSLLYVFDFFVKNCLSRYMWVYFWPQSSVPLVCVSVFLPITCCFGYCHFVVQFEVRECDTFGFVLFSQYYFGYLGSFVVAYKSDNCFCSNSVIALNLYIALGDINLTLKARAVKAKIN